MRRETRLCHYGRGELPGPANPPVVHASTILHDTVASYHDTKQRREDDEYVLSYGRRGTTTAHALMQAIADLEGGDGCWLFPSGVAAISSVLMALLRPGDHILVVETVFPATRKFCDTALTNYGVTTEYIPFDVSDLSQWQRPETRLIFVETPGSQTFEVMDISPLTAWARERNIPVVADNTYGSGWLYQPLNFGCDVSIIAGTKYLGGHADVMMGAASAVGEAAVKLREAVHLTGQTLAPDEAYLTLRGMRTLPLRLERHGDNARALVRWLQDRPEVAYVLHPDQPDHPGHRIWARDAGGSNGLFSVIFTDGFDVHPFLDRLRLFSIGSSWGGFESLAMPISPDRNRPWLGNYPDGGMARFHAGLEHIDDLIEDLETAFSAA